MKNQKIRSMKVHEQSGYNYKAKTREDVMMRRFRKNVKRQNPWLEDLLLQKSMWIKNGDT